MQSISAPPHEGDRYGADSVVGCRDRVSPSASPSIAQVTTADIVGRVSDASGGVLPGATVTIEHRATRDIRTAVAGVVW